MAIKHEGRVLKITTPSRFGSHKSMVVGIVEGTQVVCQDDEGVYLTDQSRLDNGLADPNRYSEARKNKEQFMIAGV